MKTQTLAIKLLAPAFLGDAAQSGVWRTPPLKALLREWWRVAAAPTHAYDHSELRSTEGTLLGNAWLEGHESQSKVRMALKHWDAGKMTSVSDEGKVPHSEVGRPVGSQLYLGYGPLIYDKTSGTKIKNGAALQAKETNELALAWPDVESGIPHALQLAHWFGTIGGRSRNGWGSIDLGLEALTKDHSQLIAVERDIRECLKLDWPHAIGKDDKGTLIWESSASFDDWQKAITFLAKTKIGFRTDLKFTGGKLHPQPQERHIIAYPVTNHDVSGWGGNTRLANQLRFKLFLDPQKKLRARIYHTPHKNPLDVGQINELGVWKKIHAWLDDAAHGLQRLGASA